MEGTTPTFTGNIIIDNLTIPSGCTNYPVFSNAWSIYGTTSPSITINSGANVTFSSKLNIGAGTTRYGLVTVNPRGFLKVNGLLTINPSGSLVVKSDYSGEGQANYGSIGGTSILSSIELYLPGGSAQFHYFVPPLAVYIGTLISDVRDALYITNFNGDLMLYDEPSAVLKQNGWQYFDGYGSTSGFESISPLQGYNIYLTDNDKLIFTGNLNVSNQTYNLSYTSGNADPGWNLIGNPFPCNYDLSGISALMTDNDDINNYVYYNSNGGYVYWNPKDGTGSSVCTDIIPPMHGFFVHALSSGKSVTLPISSKTFSTAQSRMKGVGSSAKSVATKKIKLVLNSPSQSDETMVGIFDDATLDFNQNHDANKMFNTEPSPYIYSEINGVDYFMKSIIAPSSQPIEVPLKVVLTESGSNTIKITEFDNMEAYKITLKHGDIQVPLTAGTIYNFNSNPGTYSDYSLVFNSILTSVDNPNETLLKTWYRNNYLYINYPSDFKAGNSEINIYDFNGRKVFGNKNLDITPGETKQIQVSLKKGFYLTEIVTGLKQYKSKIVVY